jgi:hypothetical protein
VPGNGPGFAANRAFAGRAGVTQGAVGQRREVDLNEMFRPADLDLEQEPLRVGGDAKEEAAGDGIGAGDPEGQREAEFRAP